MDRDISGQTIKKCKEELSMKLQVEVQKLNDSFKKLQGDKETELIDVRKAVVSQVRHVDRRIHAHITKTKK
jgi:LEA14-like dessication related protein